MLGALELVSNKADKTPFAPAVKLPTRLFEIGYRNGILFRAFADGTIGLAPALSCTAEEMGELLRRLTRTLDETLAEAEVRAALR